MQGPGEQTMLISEADTEHFEIWFSYAGAQKTVVEAMAKQLRDEGDTLMAEIERIYSQPPEPLKKLRLTPQRYQREMVDGNWVFEKGNGCSIDQLTHDIGHAFLRVVILSKEYFSSRACMEELTACLCAHYMKHRLFPCLFLSGFNKPEDVLKDTEFSFYYQQDGETATLAQALEYTREQMQQSDKKHWQEFDFQPNRDEPFTALLEDWSRRIFSEANLQVVIEDQDKDARRWATDVYRYSLQKVGDSAFQAFDNLETYLIKDLLSKSDFQQFLAVLHIETEQKMAGKIQTISNADSVESFMKEVEESIKNEAKRLKEVPGLSQYLQRLCGLVIFRALKSVYITLFIRLRSISRQCIVFINNESEKDFDHELTAAVVNIALYNKSPVFSQLELSKQATENGSFSAIQNLIFTDGRSYSAGEYSEKDAIDVINKCMRISLLASYPAGTHIDSSDRRTRHIFRKELQKSPEQSQVESLVTRREYSRGDKDYYQDLKRIHQCLNQLIKDDNDQPDMVIPSIVLASAAGDAKEKKCVLITDESAWQIETGINAIANALNTYVYSNVVRTQYA